MAISTAHYSVFTPRFNIPSKTLTLTLTTPRSLLLSNTENPGPSFSVSTSHPLRLNGNHHELQFPLSASKHVVNATKNDEDSIRDSNDDMRQLSSMVALLEGYKAAFLSGDEKTLREIENKLCSIELKKKELFDKVSVLSAEMTSGKDKYIRLQADFDNFRKRAEKETLNVRTNARKEVIQSLLPIVDNFERSRQQTKPGTEKEKKIDTSYQGIYKQFVEIMRSLQVSAIATVGKPFDPKLHDAVSREESQEYKAGIVTREIRRGFLLGGQLLRPAKVIVSAGPGSKPAAGKSVGQQATAAGLDERHCKEPFSGVATGKSWNSGFGPKA